MARLGRPPGPRKVAFPLGIDMVPVAEDMTADSALEPGLVEEQERISPARSMLMMGSKITEDPVRPAPSIAPDPTTDPKGYEAYVAELRQKRKPYGAQMQKLAYPPRSGYKRHWFNDVGGRVQDYMDNGWSIVHDPKGRPVERTVGAARDNTPLKAKLLEIPSIFWEEVEAERHAFAKSKMDDIKSAPIRSKPGEAKASDQGKFYSPKEEMVSMTEGLSRR